MLNKRREMYTSGLNSYIIEGLHLNSNMFGKDTINSCII